MPEFLYEDLLPIGEDPPSTAAHHRGRVDRRRTDGRTFLKVEPEALRLLTETALHDISQLPAHGPPEAVASILDDPGVGQRKFVAFGPPEERPTSPRGRAADVQDTAPRSSWASAASRCPHSGRRRGVDRPWRVRPYTKLNLRYSQNAPITMWEEKNTGNNLPAQIELYADTAKGTRTPTVPVSWPRAADRPTSRTCTRRRRPS